MEMQRYKNSQETSEEEQVGKVSHWILNVINLLKLIVYYWNSEKKWPKEWNSEEPKF